jgi:hypothetical protein
MDSLHSRVHTVLVDVFWTLRIYLVYRGLLFSMSLATYVA